MSLKHWIPAVVAAAMVAAGVSGVTAVKADAAVTLPAKTPQQVLELAAGSHVQAFSGTFTETTDLGLPQLPAGMAAGAGASAADLSNTLSLLTDPHTARVYVDGPAKQRLQVMEQGAERDVVRNGQTVWAYDSAADTATHITLPASQRKAFRPDSMHTLPTPQQVADQALAAVTPTTQLTVDAAQRVAGRPAYTLVLTPKTTATLVGQVRIAVDAATGLPLSASVTARGATTPAVSVAYTSISLQTPPAARFAFTPPAGTTVKTITPITPQLPAKPAPGAQHPARPQTIGQGWTAIAALPAGTLNAKALAQPALRELSTAVAGGRMISTSLVSIYITDTGRVYAGSVGTQALLAAVQNAR